MLASCFLWWTITHHKKVGYYPPNFKGSLETFCTMETTPAQKAQFLKKFGEKVNQAIYERYGTKNAFLKKTGYDKTALHSVTTGGDTRLSTALKIARALGIKVRDLLPDE
jgi:hypothetical protein